MFRHLVGIVGVCGLAMLGCSSAAPRSLAASAGCTRVGDTSAAARSFLARGNVYEAHQVKQQVFVARSIQPFVPAGADLYVHAEPGITGESLERTLSCHAASGRAVDPSDPFHPESGAIADVRVRPVRSGYAVRVAGEDVATNREIWQRARSIASSTSVTIEQLAAAE